MTQSDLGGGANLGPRGLLSLGALVDSPPFLTSVLPLGVSAYTGIVYFFSHLPELSLAWFSAVGVPQQSSN